VALGTLILFLGGESWLGRILAVLLFPFVCALAFVMGLLIGVMIALGLKFLLLGLVLVFNKAMGFVIWLETVGFGVLSTVVHARHLYHEAGDARAALQELKKALAG
jgi:hypothetical protein